MQRTPEFVLCGNLAASAWIGNTCVQKSRILLGKSKHKKAAKFAAVISTTHVESLVPICQSKYAATISSEKRINFGDTDFHFPYSSADTFCHKHSLKCQEYLYLHVHIVRIVPTANFGAPIMPTVIFEKRRIFQISPFLNLLAWRP